MAYQFTRFRSFVLASKGVTLSPPIYSRLAC